MWCSTATILTFLFQVISGVGLPLMISQDRLADSPSLTIRTPSDGTGRISGATERKLEDWSASTASTRKIRMAQTEVAKLVEGGRFQLNFCCAFVISAKIETPKFESDHRHCFKLLNIWLNIFENKHYVIKEKQNARMNKEFLRCSARCSS